jgi:putative phosphoesterase
VDLIRSADLVIHAGDFVSAAVLEDIEALGRPVHAVYGNMDSSELRGRLPAETVLRAGDVAIGIVHDGGAGRGRLERLQRRFPATQAVVFGHSHLPLHESSGNFQIFNPGSPTDRRRAPSHTMGLARINGEQVAFELVEV